MRYAVCLLDPEWGGITDALRRLYEALPRARGLEFAWWSFGSAAVLTAWDDPWGDPLIVSDGDWTAVGIARLDNRAEVARQVDVRAEQLTDLNLALRLVAQRGNGCIRDLLGDFAFVVWNSRTQALVAATDALSVRKLFYAQRDGILAFATRAEALALDERYDARHLAEFIALCPATPGLTPYEGVRRLLAGTTALLRQGALALQTYWSPEQFEPVRFTPSLEHEAPARLRELLSDSVRQRLSGADDTWSQLSGGLDSSSIVSLSQWLLKEGVVSRGVAGTASFVDWQNTDADEREYSNAVASHWQLRNETIVDPPLWIEGDAAPPHLDEPRDSLAFHPRERRLCAIVRRAGGQVLLTGFGSDELFTGTPVFFADWLVRGRIWTAACELARWAARGRTSFWEIAYGNALLPLVPQKLRHPASFNDGRLLPWIAKSGARRYALRQRTSSVTGSGGRVGRKYRDMMLQRVRALATRLDAGEIGDALDVRYPFLARPLVEFALRLPPELCVRPHARKWVLREAMRGILPELIRTRIGKGGPTDRLVRSLTEDRNFLMPLLHEPILADLQIVDPQRLRLAFDTAALTPHGDRSLAADVQKTLMVEAWLRIRSGRWPPGPSLS